MAKTRSLRREAVAAVLAITIAVAYGVDLIGEQLRLVHVLTLVALSIAAGVAIARVGSIIHRNREERKPTGNTVA